MTHRVHKFHKRKMSVVHICSQKDTQLPSTLTLIHQWDHRSSCLWVNDTHCWYHWNEKASKSQAGSIIKQDRSEYLLKLEEHYKPYFLLYTTDYCI